MTKSVYGGDLHEFSEHLHANFLGLLVCRNHHQLRLTLFVINNSGGNSINCEDNKCLPVPSDIVSKGLSSN